MTATAAVARKSRNFAGANYERTFAAGERDRNLARIILDDERLAGVPESWVIIAHARAEQPEDATWAEIGESVGWTKDRAVSCWRRLAQSLGYLPRDPSTGRGTRIKDRS